METKKIILKEVKRQGNSIYFFIESDCLILPMRIAYNDVTRKNALHKSLVVSEIYFQPDLYPVLLSENKDSVMCTRSESVLDLLLLAERKAQWILEQLTRNK